MKTYGVTLPFTGKIHIVVQAENEDQAVTLAEQQCTSSDMEGWEVDTSRAEVEDETMGLEGGQ